MSSTSPMVLVPCSTYISVTWLPVLRTAKVVRPAGRVAVAGSQVVLVATTDTVALALLVHAAAPSAATASHNDRLRISSSSGERASAGEHGGAGRLPVGDRCHSRPRVGRPEEQQ